jgi:hypothetical protein
VTLAPSHHGRQSTIGSQSFYAVADEPFDKDYMNRLFRLGQRRALAGDAWLRLDEPD